jgi:TATA-box binding protein (TBP) (component of TFIID and TFIIIB)
MFDPNEQLTLFSNDFLSLMSQSHSFSTDIGFSTISISTMTIVCKTNTDTIDMEKFVNNFDTYIDFDASLKKKQRTDDPIITKRGKIKKNFFNQATLTFKDTTTKSIKIFTNGKLQMTGITSMIEGIKVASKVCALISKCVSADVKASTVDIAMINSDFCIRRNVNLYSMLNIMSNDDTISCAYDPDTYPGLKIKYNKVSIFVFGTGSVVITGSNSLQRLKEAFTYIGNIVKDNESILWGKSKEKKRIIIYTHGYPKNTLDCCAKKYDI